MKEKNNDESMNHTLFELEIRIELKSYEREKIYYFTQFLNLWYTIKCS